jgi:hypothetical protein
MLKRSLVAKVLPGLAVSGVLIASIVASPAGLLSSLSGYGYGVCGYGYSAFGGTATVTGLSPTSGTTAGGTSVFITGSGYCNSVSAVHFGTSPAQSINVLADTLIQAVSPAHAAGAVDVTVINAAGTSATSSADLYTFTNPTPSVYTALSPQRILDTRTNSGTLGPGGSVNLSIGGIYVPANATSVVLNVTAADESTAGFFTVYPTGGTTPLASNLNWSAGEIVPNLVSSGLSSGGDVTIFNGLGSADAIVDLEGYFAPASGGSTAGQFVPLAPSRISDTRAASNKPNAGQTLAAGTTLNVTVAGVGGVPTSGVSAVVLNVTAADQTANGVFTVFPTGTTRPLASNLNWTPGMPVPNRVVVPLTAGVGQESIYNPLGSADAIVDVNGYFTDSTAAGAGFFTLFPSRIVDTRNGTGAPMAPVGAGATLDVTVAGHGGVPSAGATAVIVNVTVANPTTASDLAISPHGVVAATSDLNFVGGQTVANLVIVKLSALGHIDIFNAFGTTNVIVDVVGYYT